MWTDLRGEAGTMVPEVTPLREVPMVSRERWEEVRRLGDIEMWKVRMEYELSNTLSNTLD